MKAIGESQLGKKKTKRRRHSNKTKFIVNIEEHMSIPLALFKKKRRRSLTKCIE